MNRRQLLVAAASLPVALRAGLAAARPAGGRPLALVTCDTQARVAAVDVTTLEIVRSIDTLPAPRSIERALDSALVAHTTEGALTLIGPDLEPVRVVHGFDEPRYAAVDPWKRHAFVSDSGSHEVAVLDHRGRTLARLAVGGPARHVGLRHAGVRLLWTVLGSRAEQVAVLDVDDPTRPRLRRRLTPPFLAHDVGFTPDGRHAWVTSGNERRIALYTADGRHLRTIPAGAPPQHVSFLDDRAYVTSGDDGTLSVHRAHTGELLRRRRIPVGSYNVQAEHRWILSPSLEGGSLAVATPTGQTVRTTDVSPSSHDACLLVA